MSAGANMSLARGQRLIKQPEATQVGPAKTWMNSARLVGKDLAVIVLLTFLLPLNLALTLVALLLRPFLRWSAGYRRPLASDAKTVLISGGKMTKALQLARLFRRSGHRVVLCETDNYWLTGHRFSAAVQKFVTTADPGSPDYAASLLRIVRQEGCDVYVPVCSPVASEHVPRRSRRWRRLAR